jgi:amino acid adenylation domain-containing protein
MSVSSSYDTVLTQEESVHIQEEELFAFPPSFAQKRLWFLDQLEPGNPAYNIPSAFHLVGSLDIPALEQSINEIIRRHESLRTTITSVDGQPVQLVAQELYLPLTVVDLSEHIGKEQEVELQRLVVEEARHPFNLGVGPLLRATLLRLSEQDHVFVVNVHHIVSDGWSNGIFANELAALYEAYRSGKPSPLGKVPIQYADFTIWEQEYLQAEALQEDLDYWKQKLAGPLPVLEMPTLRPRLPIQGYRGAWQEVALSKSLTESLKALSRQETVSLFMTLLAAFKVLLHRYSRQTDLAVGTPVANRNLAEVEEVIGFFVNTVVFRTDVSGNPSFRNLLERVREVTLGAYAHQGVPFERLVEELKPERDLSHNPLFQVMFTLQDAPMEITLAGVQVKPFKFDNLTSKFDLYLELWETEEGVRGRAEYDTDLFDEETITCMVGHFQTLLEAIVANPDESIAKLQLLTEAERRLLLEEWNDTAMDYPKDRCVHHLLEEQVERTPEAVAIEFAGATLTYQELNQRANQLAHHLRRQGVGPESLVGLCLERSPEMVIGLLAILKAGGAYVPLDATYPQSRLAFMLEDAEVGVVVTTSRMLNQLPTHGARVICMDTDWDSIGREIKSNPETWNKADNLAYVIYTSGSTGRPKGVMIPHQGLVNYLSWATNNYRVADGDSTPLHSPLGFDLTVTSLFPALLTGKSVQLLADEGGLKTLEELGKTAGNHSLVKITPAHLEVLGQQMPASSASGWTKALIIGGEALYSEQLTFWQQYSPKTRLINEYGPTETVVGCCVYEVKEREQLNGPVPIGRPIANTRLYVLDECGEPVPVGVTGELYIGGDGVARGYLKREELNKERFVEDRFSGRTGSRLYKTGDMVRYRRDGNLEFLGRTDYQVKVRGYRIELGEIEGVLAQLDGVREAAVVVREDEPGDRRLVAYVVLEASGESRLGQLRGELKQRLPEYMVPSAFMGLDEMPLTSNGKVDRKSLPAPEVREAEGEYIKPCDEVESRLVKIWEKVLGYEPISIKDNFFELGGHSLLGVKLFAAIEKEFGKRLPLTTLFHTQTIEEMARGLREEKKEDEESWSALVAIQPKGNKLPFFCVHAGGGNVLFYRDLSRRLGEEQPFYGLQAVGLDGKGRRHNRVDEMAAHYIREMRRVQPKGPYYVGGASFGGLAAYEIACQLRQMGEEVGMIVLFDTYGPGYPRLLPTTTAFRVKMSEYYRRVEHHIGGLTLLKGRARLEYVKHKSDKVRVAFIRWCLKKSKAAKKRFYEVVGRPLPKVLQETQHALVEAQANYEPREYGGHVTLFRASKQPSGIYSDPTLGWGQVVKGELEIYEVPGYHAAIVTEPRVRYLIDDLKKCLSRSQPQRANQSKSVAAKAAGIIL